MPIKNKKEKRRRKYRITARTIFKGKEKVERDAAQAGMPVEGYIRMKLGIDKIEKKEGLS